MHSVPHDAALEYAILSSMLLYDSAALAASVALTPDDFHVYVHSVVFDRMQMVLAKTHQVDPVNLRSYCAGEPQVLEYLDDVMFRGYEHLTGRALDEAISRLKELTTLRRFSKACIQALAWASESGARVSPGECVDRGSAEITKALADRGAATRGADIDELMRPICDDIIALQEGKALAPNRAIPAPLRELESLLNGFKPGQSIVIAARPGSGKTVMGLMCAEAALKVGRRSIVYSFEMSKEELAERMLASRAEVDSKIISRRAFSRDEGQRAFRAMNTFVGQRMRIVDSHRWTIDQVSRDARREHMQDPLGIIVIDYLQLISPRSRNGNREQEISEISRECKLLAKELSIPVIELAQMNRSVETRESREPQLSDLRESGSIEQDADVVLFLTLDPNDPSSSKMFLRKQRGGQLGVFGVKFEGKYARFKSHDGYA